MRKYTKKRDPILRAVRAFHRIQNTLLAHGLNNVECNRIDLLRQYHDLIAKYGDELKIIPLPEEKIRANAQRIAAEKVAWHVRSRG